MAIKISKVAKELNVAVPTVIEFLRKKNIEIDGNPNTRIEDDLVDLLVKEFKPDQVLKSQSDQMTSERKKEAKPAKDAPRPVEEIKLPSETIKPKFVGKIELDAKGNPIVPKPEPKPSQAEIEAQKAAEKAAA